MINRCYFIAGEVYLKNGTKTMFFRQFYHKSIFENPGQALEIKQREIAIDNMVDVTELAITAFNRC